MTHFALQTQSREWLNAAAVQCHYMHRALSARAISFGWGFTFDNHLFMSDKLPVGFIIYASIHYTRLRGEFGYPDLPTKWQVLSLARFWLHPAFQHGGEYYSPEYLPGFIDRKGEFRSTLATELIHRSFECVQYRWLEVHPPPRPNEPYHIVKIISYADTYYHTGAIYREAKFRHYGETTSEPRHKGTRGNGQAGHKLICYIYDLPMPTWEYKPSQLTLF